MTMSPETLRTDHEPFREPLIELQMAHGSETVFSQFALDPRYIIRGEPIGPGYSPQSRREWGRQREALAEFETVSGLKVVPHWDVISHPQRGHNDDGYGKVMYHIAARVQGKEVYETKPSYLPSHSISPANAARLTDSINTYFIDAYDNKKPSIFEIRPVQFMYGTINNDQEPDFYMVDVDHATTQSVTTLSDVTWCMHENLQYMQKYGAKAEFHKSAWTILSFLDRPDIVADFTSNQRGRRNLEEFRDDVLDYIDAIEHLTPYLDGESAILAA